MEKIEQLADSEQEEQLIGREEISVVVLESEEGETKTSKKNKGYDLADVRSFTERNAEVDYKILLALYEHRALTPSQIKKGWFPGLHINSIRNRTKTLAERRILTVNTKAGIKTSPVKMYSLSTFGLRILIENYLQVMEYEPQLDERKQHFTIDDLKVRSQHFHHYELQEWVIDLLAKRPKLFHCEWRRFPFLDEKNNVSVRPDWLFLEVDEKTTLHTNDDSANNPLLYPYFYRKEQFPEVTLTPTLCVECDRGMMNRMELVDKWEGYKSLPTHYKPKAITMFYTPKNHVDMRQRLIRESMSYAFELEVIQDEIQLFQGDHELTQEIVSLYLEREKDLLNGEDMTKEQELSKWVESYSCSLESGEASILDVSKTVNHLKLPVRPDVIIAKEQKTTSLQLVFFALRGWVNPIIKIQAIKRWMKEGHLSLFSEIQFILLYPDLSFHNDVRQIESDVYYVSYQEVKELESWGKAHYELRKHRQVKWQEVTL